MSEMQEKSSLTRDEVLAALPGYVLEALTPEEMRAVEQYLQQHPELKERARELDAAAAAMALSAPQHPLPAETKNRVMQRVRTDVQADRRLLGGRARRPGRQESASPAAMPGPAAHDGHETASGDISGRRRGGMARLRLWWAERRYANAALVLAGALALLLLIAVLQTQALLYQSSASLNQLQAQVAALETENEALRHENQVLQEAVINQREQWASILAAGESVALSGTEDAPASQGIIYVEGADLLVFAAGLTELAENQTYQLWLIPPDEDPISAGTFDAAADGTAAFQSEAPWPWDSYAAVGISVEPAGGSPTPTGPIVLRGDSR